MTSPSAVAFWSASALRDDETGPPLQSLARAMTVSKVPLRDPSSEESLPQRQQLSRQQGMRTARRLDSRRSRASSASPVARTATARCDARAAPQWSQRREPLTDPRSCPALA